MDIGVLTRRHWRNTGIESFEEKIVQHLLDKEEFHSIDFHISDKYPLSGTISRLRLGKKVKRAVSKNNLDVVFVPSQDLMLGINPETIQARIVPYIHDILTISTAFPSRFVKLIDKKAAYNIEEGTYAMTASNKTKQEVIERTNFDGNADTIYQDVNFEPERGTGYEEREIDIIYIGTLIKRKNPELIRKVANRCKKNDLNMIAVNYQELDLPCTTYTDVSNKRLKALLDNSRYYLHPSFQEGFGRGAIEAQRRGVPVIARNNQINNEILQDFIEAESAKQVMSKIENQYNWEERSRNAVKNTKRFDWNSTKTQIANKLRETAK